MNIVGDLTMTNTCYCTGRCRMPPYTCSGHDLNSWPPLNPNPWTPPPPPMVPFPYPNPLDPYLPTTPWYEDENQRLREENERLRLEIEEMKRRASQDLNTYTISFKDNSNV